MKTMEDRVGQMLMGGFDGLTAPAYFLEWLREGRLGGAILFGRNVESPAQLAALTAQLHGAAKHPLLVAIDQEGGTVARLRDGFSESPGALALASIAHDAERVTEAVSAVLGQELYTLGINWTYAPVVDITYNVTNPTVGTRSFGSDPERVAVLAAAATRGFQSAGVAACAKHFPGLGNTAIDTHLALPRLDTPLEQILTNDLLPYRVLIERGLAAIMTTHTIITALDAEHPATLSEHLVRLLRDTLGFDGVVTTDCLEMKAIDDHYGIADSVVRAANAGIDIILVSHTPQKQADAYDHLLAAVRRGDVPEARVDAAHARIAAMKARFPIPASFAATTPDLTSIFSQAHQQTMQAAANAAVTLVRAEGGVLPLRPGQRIHLIEFAMMLDSLVQENHAVSPLAQVLKARLRGEISAVLLPANPDEAHIPHITQDTAFANADIVIVASRSAHLNPAQAEMVRQIAAALHAAQRHLVLLALRNPYDAVLVATGTVICTGGDSAPSLLAAAAALTGEFVPSGRLPLEV